MAAHAVFVPVDPSWPTYLIERAAGGIAPRIIIAKRRGLAALSTTFPQAIRLPLEPGVADRLSSVSIPEQSSDPMAPATYLFTSGTTGIPKAVVHSRSSMATSAAHVLETFGWKRGERLLNLPELHTMSGIRNALIAAPIGGIEWFPSPSSERSNLFDLVRQIEESRCDHLVAGPSLVRQLAAFGDRIGGALASVKAIYCTGAALAHEASQAVYQRFGIPVINYYGLTETGGICLSQGREDWDPGDASLGEPVGCEVRLVGLDAGSSGAGELQVRSGQLMTGYLNDAEATARRFDDGWLKTGDVMHIDESGRYHLRGRADLFIKTRTTDRIHPEEIEAVLELHYAVAEAAVVGVPDPNGGERLVALTVLAEGPCADGRLVNNLADFVVTRLGESRKPNEIRFVHDLPRLPNGKLNRPELIGLFA
jgi:acyl-coenzyme A synthetase/AMP-(fatty) acid ligase